MPSFWVYILLCADASYYVGHTDDLDKRLGQHQSGEYCGFTKNRRPVKLVYADETNDRGYAIERERQIKGWSRAKKEALIKGNIARLEEIAAL